jgi:hypothetical protein
MAKMRSVTDQMKAESLGLVVAMATCSGKRVGRAPTNSGL